MDHSSFGLSAAIPNYCKFDCGFCGVEDNDSVYPDDLALQFGGSFSGDSR